MDKPRVLIVDDEETIRHILVTVIEGYGCETRQAGSAEEGLDRLAEFTPDVALLDIVLPGKNGLELLVEIKQRLPDTEVVMMTSHASAETAMRALRQGAYTYLTKPFEDLEQIWTTVQRALEKRSLGQKNRSLLQKHEERSTELSSNISLISPEFEADGPDSSSELIDFFLDMVTRELKVEDACIMLLDPARKELRVVASRGSTRMDPGNLRIRSGEGVAGFVAQTGDPCVPGAALSVDLPRGGTTPDRTENLFSEPFALCVPIKSEGKVLGVLATANRKTGRPFEDGDISHITSLAAQLAAALDGSRRADQLQKAYESLKSTQDQLVRSERLKVIGNMAADVAHDFNNVLSVILARAEFLQREMGQKKIDRDKIRRDVETIITVALQGADTIRRIQNYTRIRKDEPRAPVDLNAAIRDAVEITRPKWKREPEARGRPINVQLDLKDVPPVAGHALELTQVVENLIFNAVDAMPNGGQIAVKTSADDGPVVMEISDSGTGMDARTQIRLFEPFFTTKNSRQGLGTSIVYGIVTRHKGEISVQSILGAGTTYRITFPALTKDRVGDEPNPGPVESRFRTARILLVDDEEAVRLAHQELMAAEGHDVTTASGSNEAISVFAKGKFDIVITDLSSGPTAGIELAAHVKRIDPGVVAILLTGRTIKPEEERQLRGSGFDTILLKPCPLDILLSTIQRFLRRPAAA